MTSLRWTAPNHREEGRPKSTKKSDLGIDVWTVSLKYSWRNMEAQRKLAIQSKVVCDL